MASLISRETISLPPSPSLPLHPRHHSSHWVPLGPSAFFYRYTKVFVCSQKNAPFYNSQCRHRNANTKLNEFANLCCTVHTVYTLSMLSLPSSVFTLLPSSLSLPSSAYFPSSLSIPSSPYFLCRCIFLLHAVLFVAVPSFLKLSLSSRCFADCCLFHLISASFVVVGVASFFSSSFVDVPAVFTLFLGAIQ